MHCEFSEAQRYPLHRLQTKLLRVLRQGTGASGSQPQPETGKRFGDPSAVVSLPSCALPSVMSLQWMPSARAVLVPRQGNSTGGRILPLESKGYPAAMPGHLLVTGTSLTYLCCVWRGVSGQDLPSSVYLAAECCSRRAQTGCSWAACGWP